MKKIGGGWQYAVYDLENGRVLKKTATFWQSYWKIFWYQFPLSKTPIWKIPEKVRQMRTDAIHSLNSLQPIPTDLSMLLGNPSIYKDFSYEQDKVISIGNYIRRHTLEENKKIVDKYAELLIRLWGYGFNDRPFKFVFNFGVTDTGAVVLIDLGELYFTKEKAVERIKSAHWRNSFMLNRVLKKYYVEVMERTMTIENLEKHWGKTSV